MYETTITYDNSNCEFDFDGEIRATMKWWHGEETDSGQDLETNMREITFAFEDESDAAKASRALADLLGHYFEPVERRILADLPEEPQSTHPTIAFDSDHSRMPRASVSVATSSQCAGLQHREPIATARPVAAQELFAGYSKRLGWNLQIRADMLVNWLGEGMIEPLLRCIQEAGQTEDFAEFLADNFGDDSRHDENSAG